AARRWQHAFVSRALAEPRRIVAHGVSPDARGKRLFDRLRTTLTRLQASLLLKEQAARTALDNAATALTVLLIIDAVLVIGSLLAAGFVLRRTITQPLGAMRTAAQRVAGGDFEAPMPTAAGPREVSELTAEIEAMRERIVYELAQVEAARERLERQAL